MGTSKKGKPASQGRVTTNPHQRVMMTSQRVKVTSQKVKVTSQKVILSQIWTMSLNSLMDANGLPITTLMRMSLTKTQMTRSENLVKNARSSSKVRPKKDKEKVSLNYLKETSLQLAWLSLKTSLKKLKETETPKLPSMTSRTSQTSLDGTKKLLMKL